MVLRLAFGVPSDPSSPTKFWTVRQTEATSALLNDEQAICYTDQDLPLLRGGVAFICEAGLIATDKLEVNRRNPTRDTTKRAQQPPSERQES